MRLPDSTLISIILALLGPAAGAAQAPVPVRNSTDLFVLDLAGTPVGEIPTSIKQLRGTLEVVTRDGAPMLKASTASEFLITLPQVLPADFTVEFEVIPKACCNPQDLSVEGTPAINQGPASAHLLWDTDALQVIGGGDTYDSPMPEEFRATLPGVLTTVVFVFEGPTVRLYTNGRRLYTLERRFVRGRVLRVFLGGQDDGNHAVYLAGLRVAAGTGGPGVVAAQAGLPTPGQTPPRQPPPAGRQGPDTTSSAGASTGSMTNMGSGVQAAGTGKIATTEPPAATGGTSLSPRSIALPGFTATGSFGSLAPRTIALPGFTALGGFSSLAARTLMLPGFTAAGSFPSLAPRTITVPGFAAAGSFTTLPPRTITLPGWTAVGATP